MGLRDAKMPSLSDKLYAERVEEKVKDEEAADEAKTKMGKGRVIKTKKQ